MMLGRLPSGRGIRAGIQTQEQRYMKVIQQELELPFFLSQR